MTAPFPPLPPRPPPALRLPPVRRSRIAGWLALGTHVVAALLLVRLTRHGPLWEAPALAGVAPQEAGGGGGAGREVDLVVLASPAPVAAPPVAQPPRDVAPPPVTATPPPPVVIPPAPDTIVPRVVATTTSGSGGGSGGGSGPGSGPGTGPGAGPGAGGGSKAPAPDTARIAARDPEPRQQILPPFDYPRSLRGQAITVTFFVTEQGRVDRVVFAPEISDRGYARKLEDVMRAYRFYPARSPAGLPVPGRTTTVITF